MRIRNVPRSGMVAGGICCRQEVIQWHAVLLPEWYLEQYVFQPLPGVDIGGFTRCYHGIDYCSPAGRCVVASEEPVLAAQRQGADCVFDQVVVDIDTSVVDVYPQPFDQ